MPENPLLASFIAALITEEQWQRKEHAALLALPVRERVSAGITWAPMSVEAAEPTGTGRYVLRLRAPKGVVLHDGLSAGNPVMVGPLSAPDSGSIGILLGMDERVAEIRVHEGFSGEGPQAVTLQFDASTFARYRASLKRADQKRTALRDVLLGLRAPGEMPPELHDSPAFADLNPAQHHAARVALSTAEVGLVHGPPGTGKTQLIVAVLRALVMRGEQPWALADSNAAVDHLAVRAHEAGLDVVRIGHPARIGSRATRLSLDARMTQGSLAGVLHSVDKALSKLRNDTSREGRRARQELYTERERLENQARRAILQSADVIASTFGTLARVADELPKPVTAVVDEATQALEPAVWAAVPHVQRLVLVGDPNQLGPVVLEPNNPLCTTLLDRLLHEDGPELPMPVLTIQHRMNRAIQSLVDEVYDHELQPHPSVAGHLLADLPGVAETPLTTTPVLWVDTAGADNEEQRDSATHSLYNEAELAVVACALRLLREAGVSPSAIGIIAPYSAQVARLSALPEAEDIEVATVNAFQGREKEVILCSFVRSNRDGELGFVADPRRLTVALTRARRLLICTGNTATLAIHPRFAATVQRFQEIGGLQSVWEPPWCD